MDTAGRVELFRRKYGKKLANDTKVDTTTAAKQNNTKTSAKQDDTTTIAKQDNAKVASQQKSTEAKVTKETEKK